MTDFTAAIEQANKDFETKADQHLDAISQTQSVIEKASKDCTARITELQNTIVLAKEQTANALADFHKVIETQNAILSGAKPITDEAA